MGSPMFIGVECAIEHDGKFLLILRPEGVHAGGLLSFPGGGIEVVDGTPGADILKIAAQREVFEEVGLTLADPLEYVTSSYFVDNAGKQLVNVVFHCKLDKTTIVVKPSPREVPEYYWLTRQEVMHAHNAPPWLKNYLIQII